MAQNWAQLRAAHDVSRDVALTLHSMVGKDVLTFNVRLFHIDY